MATETKETSEAKMTELLDAIGRRNRKLADVCCAECGTPFRPRAKSAKYCSRACAWKNNGNNYHPQPPEAIESKRVTRLLASFTARDRNECWPWLGRINRGYGCFNENGRHRMAHLVVYEHMIGLVADGLELDHLCRNKQCVNPNHLEPVTHAENIRRTKSDLCVRGHMFDKQNTRIDIRGHRVCRKCDAIRRRKSQGNKQSAKT